MQGEAIYKGATRPAMKLGVPLTPLVVLLGTSVLLVMWSGMLLSWWVALAVVFATAPAFMWMRFVTARDDQRLRQMLIHLRLRRQDKNQSLWLARSYSPTLYRGASHVWLV